MTEDPVAADFVLSQITASLDRQASLFDSIDRKAAALLALGGGLVTILPATATRIVDFDASWRLVSLALPWAIYVVAIWFLWDAFKLRIWGVAPDPPLLKAHWLDRPVQEVRRAIIDAMVDVYGSNQSQIDAKARSLRKAAALIALEAAVLPLTVAVIAV